MSWKVVKGVYFVFACFITSWFASCFIILPSYGLAILVPQIYRSYIQFMMGTWLLFPPSMYELLFGIKVRVCGDQMKRSESSLVIANHRTRLDWMFLWSVTGRAKWSALLRIILRGDLKHLPGFGWGMQFAGYYFLSRKWATDEQYLTTKINYFNTASEPLKLLVFPEGTDYDNKTKARSDTFGENQGWPHLDYLLHPRATGFMHIVKELRKGPVTALYDITLAYPKTLPDRGEMDLLTGRMPEEIHVRVKRHDFKDLPVEKEALEAWLRELWYEKERTLKKFYSEGWFPEEDLNKPYFSPSTDNFLVPIFLLWNISTLVITYLLCVSPVTRSYFLFSNVLLVILSSLGLLEDMDQRMDCCKDDTVSSEPVTTDNSN